jgi:hypothetical protein
MAIYFFEHEFLELPEFLLTKVSPCALVQPCFHVFVFSMLFCPRISWITLLLTTVSPCGLHSFCNSHAKALRNAKFFWTRTEGRVNQAHKHTDFFLFLYSYLLLSSKLMLRSNSLKGQQAPSPGQRPGAMDDVGFRSEGAKALLSRCLWLFLPNKSLKRPKYKVV